MTFDEYAEQYMLEKGTHNYNVAQWAYFAGQSSAEPTRLQCTTCGTIYAEGVPPMVPAGGPMKLSPMAIIEMAERHKVSGWADDQVAFAVELLRTYNNTGDMKEAYLAGQSSAEQRVKELEQGKLDAERTTTYWQSYWKAKCAELERAIEQYKNVNMNLQMQCEALKAQAGESLHWGQSSDICKTSTPAAEPEKPVCFGLDDCSSHALSVCSVRDECGKKANETR